MKKQGKTVSVWMTTRQHAKYRRISKRADRSGSLIVRTLLDAYARGLEVPGLPTLR